MKHKEKFTFDINANGGLFKDSPSLRGFIGYLKLNIFIPHSRSLKDKRQVLDRIKQRARNNFNVSVAEMPTNKWQRGELFFVCINYTRNYANDLMERIESFIRSENDIHILETEKGVL